MFASKKSSDVKKYVLKLQDYKKDCTSKLRYLKIITDVVLEEEAKSIFETNYSHIYYIFHETIYSLESTSKQKAPKEEFDGSLWLLGKLLTLLPELFARGWQCHSLSQIMIRILHPGNSYRFKKEGIRYFLIWYQILGPNAPSYVHDIYADLIPGLITTNDFRGPSEEEFNSSDILDHPNMKSHPGMSVFIDSFSHPIQSIEVAAIVPPNSNEKIVPPDPRDGLEVLLYYMVQTVGVIKWRDSDVICSQRHWRGFMFLFDKFKSVYLLVVCPNYDSTNSIYKPNLSLPNPRTVSKHNELIASCIVVLVNWLSRFTYDKFIQGWFELIQDDISFEKNPNLGYTQNLIVRDTLYSSVKNIDFIHELYRQAFLFSFTNKQQIEAIRTTISVYRDWMITTPPPFVTEYSDENNSKHKRNHHIDKTLKCDKQNILQVFITYSANVFLINTSNLNITFSSKTRDSKSRPIDEQTDVCKKVLNVYRTLVMNVKMTADTWQQLLLILLKITSTVLYQKNNLGGRLAQPIFQTLIVTWIRAHTNVAIQNQLWEQFLNVLVNLTQRNELIIEWDKTMQTLTRVLCRYVYSLNLLELPLDKLAENKGKRRRAWYGNSSRVQDNLDKKSKQVDKNFQNVKMECNSQSFKQNSKCNLNAGPNLARSCSDSKILIKSLSKDKNENTCSEHFRDALNLSLDDLNFAVGNNFFLQKQPAYKRKAISLDSLFQQKEKINYNNRRCSRSPSPTASSGIDNVSVKDNLVVDPLDLQDGNHHINSDNRSIISGGTSTGWLPDVAAIMWKRMLGSLGNVNQINKSELHYQIFRYLVDMTNNLIKIKINLGITHDNINTPYLAELTPPIGIVAPWCYGALMLDSSYKKGKIAAIQLLCTLATNKYMKAKDDITIFINFLHFILIGEDRDLMFTALSYLCGSKILSMLLPGHTLLLLDIVHASTILLTSSDFKEGMQRSDVISLLGCLLCYPSDRYPKPVLQPSPGFDLMECPDMQDHILNIVLRCARREPTARGRCVSLSFLGQWILHALTQTFIVPKDTRFKQNIPSNFKETKLVPQYHPRITECMHVLLRSLQMKHSAVSGAALESLRLCLEKSKEISEIDNLAQTFIMSICRAIEIHQSKHLKLVKKSFLISLCICLGEFCMRIPEVLLVDNNCIGSNENLFKMVISVLLNIYATNQTFKMDIENLTFLDNEDFEPKIVVDDINENNFFAQEDITNLKSVIRCGAQTVAKHLISYLSQFPIGIGASRLNSVVDESDDITNCPPTENSSFVELDESKNTFNFNNIQCLMLDKHLLGSFMELELYSSGLTAGLSTSPKQVRFLLRDLNGKSCWDASYLFKEFNSNKIVTFDHFFYEYSSKTQNQANILDSILPIKLVKGMRQTLRQRLPNELPTYNKMEIDCDQLNDILQYIGNSSPECLPNQILLNSPSPSPLGSYLEANTISIIINQKANETDNLIQYFNGKQNEHGMLNKKEFLGLHNSSSGSLHFQTSRSLFNHMGLSSWERRVQINMLTKNEKLYRDLRNVDLQKCRETHKIAVIFVGFGQEDKNSILQNSSGSANFENFVAAIGWEVELETHMGFFGGLPKQGCGHTAPYYATPFLEVIYHVATRMPSNTQEAVLTKTRHLGNDEVFIVWSEHCRDYRRDILPTEFCDVLICIYPLKNGMFRVVVDKKPEVPWFGPLYQENIVGGAMLSILVRETAINAGRAKRSSLPFYQQFYEEVFRSVDTVGMRYKEATIYEDFISRIFNPNTSNCKDSTNCVSHLAAALIDTSMKLNSKVAE
ncbi:RALGAPA2 family protein [Megaselia abdita]